jgi:5'-phosphate synthase pdxT subunit
MNHIQRKKGKIGVLALQGDFAEHLKILRKIGAEMREVRVPGDLADCTHLIIPGGESTVIAKLLRSAGLWDPISERGRDGTLAIFGTCAGAILLAQRATGLHPPPTLKLLDIDVDRNAYGSQLQSFSAAIHIEHIGDLTVAFIRAPRITRVGKKAEILAAHEGVPVLVRQGRVLAAAFHPEVRGEERIHRYFLGI